MWSLYSYRYWLYFLEFTFMNILSDPSCSVWTECMKHPWMELLLIVAQQNGEVCSHMVFIRHSFISLVQVKVVHLVGCFNLGLLFPSLQEQLMYEKLKDTLTRWQALMNNSPTNKMLINRRSIFSWTLCCMSCMRDDSAHERPTFLHDQRVNEIIYAIKCI